MSLYNHFWLIVIYEYTTIIFYPDNKHALKFFLLVFVFSEISKTDYWSALEVKIILCMCNELCIIVLWNSFCVIFCFKVWMKFLQLIYI